MKHAEIVPIVKSLPEQMSIFLSLSLLYCKGVYLLTCPKSTKKVKEKPFVSVIN